MEHQPQQVEDPPLQVSQIETETAVANIGESGTDILNRLAAGNIIGNVIDDGEPTVKKEEMEIEMDFDS